MTAWLWLHLPHFAAAAARLQANLSPEAPLLVAEGGRVRDCSAEPEARGVGPGLTLREAHTRCPGAYVALWDPLYARELWERLAGHLRSLSPELEARPWDALALSTLPKPDEALPAVQQALGRARALQVPVQAGWSAGRFTASAAAQEADVGQACLVAPGGEATFLAPLPLGRLPLSAEVLQELRVLGLRTMGDFARLPSAGVGIRLGSQGLRAWRLARGEERPLPPATAPEQPPLEQRAAFDPPLEWDGALLQALQRALARLGAGLEARGLTCREVGLLVGGEGGRTWRTACRPSEPAGNAAGLAALASPLLAQLATPGGERVAELRLWAREAARRQGEQMALFAAASAAKGWLQSVLEVAARYPDCFWQGRRLDPCARLARQRAVWQPWTDPDKR
ncbi:MAG TPA: hypothetical protein PLJ35_02295 [Anaerolineae bacterium]|nr:hypothetical protein [Anaerolineae bacterium]HOQ97635.1 hypothetical protein [Anaerolineae bacterium]HPL27833.1 hypothetical protein [Anaerolineae bacterium]